MMTTFVLRSILDSWKVFASAALIGIGMSTSVHSQDESTDPFSTKTAQPDPFVDETKAQLRADQFIKKFKGVVRLTYVVRVSNVIAHVRNAAAVVISSQGVSAKGTSFPVLATSDSVFDPPNEEWFSDAPALSRSYSIYVQDPYHESISNRNQTTTIHLLNTGVGGMSGGFGPKAVPPGYPGSGGAPAGYSGPPGYGGWAAVSQKYRMGMNGAVSLPGIGDNLFPLCESESLEDIKSASGGLAFVFATTTLNNIQMEETSLLGKRTTNKTKEAVELYSLRDSTIPELLPTDKPSVPGDVQVTENGFKALLVQALPGSEVAKPLSSSEILAAYIQHAKKLKVTVPSTADGSLKASIDITSQTPKNESNKLLAEIIAVYRSTESENEKGRAKAQLEHVLSEQFDAQRNIKRLEIQELRERLNELEKQEEQRTKNKEEILAGKLKQLIRE